MGHLKLTQPRSEILKVPRHGGEPSAFDPHLTLLAQ
jgi:hypothetical protein